MINAIPYGRQSIDEKDIDAVVEVLKGDFLTQGPYVGNFEADFAQYTDATYAIAVSNGTAALHLACLALGLKPGQRVITAPITFAASANCVQYVGGITDFADIDPDTYTLCLAETEKLIKSKPKGYYSGIIPVAFGGNPVDTESFRKLADEHGLWLLVDACHAPGAYYKDSKDKEIKMGSCIYADATVFSFHPVKHIATGEGGMVTTRNEKLAKDIQDLRTHGITKNDLEYPFGDAGNQGLWYYEMQSLGYNYRLTDIQAALGITQLKKAEKGVERRRVIAEKYQEAFKPMGLKYQKELAKGTNSYHLFIIEVEKRKELYDFLRANNIFAQIHYIPVHLMPYYKNLGFNKGDYPKAENYYNHCISLPMYPSLTDEEQSFVIDKVKEFINGK